MKQIKLTGKYGVGKYALVDNEDFDFLDQYWWCLNKKEDGRFYVVSKINGKMIKMHRLILNAKKNQILDHKNGDGLDNRRENLRFCTQSENCLNKKRSKNKIVPFKGVHPSGSSINPWLATIIYKGKRNYLGCFPTPELAHNAYKNKAKELAGEFAHD